MNLDAASSRYLPLVNLELRALMETPTPLLGTYYGMMQYHLGWRDQSLAWTEFSSGKRLRPLLCLLSAEAAGGIPEQAAPAAAALELVHNFSLVHDDIQDNSMTRRGRPAVWALWGTAQAITVGDGLFVLARRALHRLSEVGVPLHRCLAAFEALDQACLALCEGQFLDIEYGRRPEVTLDEYLAMIRGKTAALLAASAELGAITATDDQVVVQKHTQCGEHLGMAFQIQDDILGIWGDEELTGKPAATDLRDKKKTLPVVFALNQAQDRAVAGRLSALFSASAPLPEEAVAAVLRLLERAGARSYAQDLAEEYTELALSELRGLDLTSPAYAALRELTLSLVHRKA